LLLNRLHESLNELLVDLLIGAADPFFKTSNGIGVKDLRLSIPQTRSA
jgi:hypothetical protein